MSDPVLIAIITSISGTISLLIGLLTAWLMRKEVAAVKTLVESDVAHTVAVKESVDNYHKEVNGNMVKLLDTTAALGRQEGKDQEQKDQAGREASK